MMVYNLEGLKQQTKELKKKMPSNEPIAIIVDVTKGEKIPNNLPRGTTIIIDDIT